MHHGHHSSQGQPLTHFAYKPWGTVMAVGHDHGLGAQSSPGMRVVLLPLTRILLPTPPHTSSPPSTLTPDPHQFLSLAPALPSPSSPLPPPAPRPTSWWRCYSLPLRRMRSLTTSSSSTRARLPSTAPARMPCPSLPPWAWSAPHARRQQTSCRRCSQRRTSRWVGAAHGLARWVGACLLSAAFSAVGFINSGVVQCLVIMCAMNPSLLGFDGPAPLH